MAKAAIAGLSILVVGLLLAGLVLSGVATGVSTALPGSGGGGATGSKQCGGSAGTQFTYNITISASAISILCSKISFGNITSLPTGCVSGQYAHGVNSTNFICSAVGWTQLTGFPSGCPNGEYVQVIASAISCISDQTNTDLANLKLYYPFDEGQGSTVYDMSGNGFLGSAVDNPTWVTGKFGDALNFSNSFNQYVDGGTSTSLQFTSGFSVSAWVNRLGCMSFDTAFIEEASTAAYNYFLGMRGSGDGGCNPYFAYNDGSSFKTAENSTALTASTWYLLMGVWNTTLLTLYVNGISRATFSTSSTPSTGTPHFYVGFNNLVGAYANAKIDDVRVYSVAETANQASQLYYNTPFPFETQLFSFSTAQPNIYSTSLPPPQAYYPMDDDSTPYTTVNDYSYNGNTGALTMIPQTFSTTAKQCSTSTTSTATTQSCTVSFTGTTGCSQTSCVAVVVYTTGNGGANWGAYTTPTGTGGETYAQAVGRTTNGVASEEIFTATYAGSSTTITCSAVTGGSAGTYKMDCYAYVVVGPVNGGTFSFAGVGTGTSTTPAATSTVPVATSIVIGAVVTASLPTGTAFTAGATYTLGVASASATIGETEYLENAPAAGTTAPMTLGSSVAWVDMAIYIEITQVAQSNFWFGVNSAGCIFKSHCGAFDGGSTYIAVQDSASLHLSKSFSWSVWLKPQSFAGCTCTVFGDSTGSGAAGYFLRFAGGAGNNELDYNFGDGSNAHEFTDPYVFSTGVYYNIVITYDGSTIRSYVNGIQFASHTLTATPASSGNEFDIGKYSGLTFTSGQFLLSNLDDLRIWTSYALTPTQVSQEYNNLNPDLISPTTIVDCPSGSTVFSILTGAACGGTMRVRADVPSSSATATSTTMNYVLAANTEYSFNAQMYVTTASSSSLGLQIHVLDSGASVLDACASATFGNSIFANGCVTTTGSNMLPSGSSPTGSTMVVNAYGTITVGANPTILQIDLNDPAALGTTTLKAGSWLTVTPVS